MYYVCKRKEWSDTPLQGGAGSLLSMALESLQGQRVTEDQLRFALDVYAQEFNGNPWQTFKEGLADLLAARRITMDKREIMQLQNDAIAQIKEALQPVREAVKAEIMGALDDVARKWQVDGLEWGVANIAEKRLVANIMRKAKDDKICECGHHEKAHKHDSNDSRVGRVCRLCRDGSCEDFHPAGRPRSY